MTYMRNGKIQEPFTFYTKPIVIEWLLKHYQTDSEGNEIKKWRWQEKKFSQLVPIAYARIAQLKKDANNIGSNR